MSRTFSLWRLLVGVTVLCVVCALAVNFPQAILMAALILPYLVVPLVCAWLIGMFSRRRRLTFAISLFGGLNGLLVALTADRRFGVSSWDSYSTDVWDSAFWTAGGAILLGLVSLWLFGAREIKAVDSQHE